MKTKFTEPKIIAIHSESKNDIKDKYRDIRCTIHNYSLIHSFYYIQFQFLPRKRCILFIYSFIQHTSVITVTATMTRGSWTVHLCVIPDPGSRRQI